MSSFFAKVWGPYERWLARSPLIAKSVTTGVLGCLGDVIAQNIEHRFVEDGEKKPFDWMRNARLTGFGFVFIGPMLHGWYGFLSRAIPATTTTAVIQKMLLDQTIFAPTVMTTFFVGLGVLEGMGKDQIITKYKAAFWPTMTANWSVWPVAQLINFKFVPTLFQPLYINFVSLGWNTYLSMANARHAAHAHAHGHQDTAVAAPEPAATAVSKTRSEA